MFSKIIDNKQNIFDVIKSVLIALLCSVILVLVFALFVKYMSLEKNVIVPVNYFIKISSILLGAVLGIKNKNGGVVKGALIGVFYYLMSILLFSIFSLNFGIIKFSYIDFLCLLLTGIISGIIAVNIRNRK